MLVFDKKSYCQEMKDNHMCKQMTCAMCEWATKYDGKAISKQKLVGDDRYEYLLDDAGKYIVPREWLKELDKEYIFDANKFCAWKQANTGGCGKIRCDECIDSVWIFEANNHKVKVFGKEPKYLVAFNGKARCVEKQCLREVINEWQT